MIELELVQGTPEWHAARAAHNCASEAPAMMGAGKYQSRGELMREKATGVKPDVSPAQQERFDRGHATEAAARAILEERLGVELFPIVATDDDDYLLASVDGLTMDGKTAYEHKLLNADVVQMIRLGDLSPAYYWQLEQILYVTRSKRVIFVCSDGTDENFHHLEYQAVPGRAEQLLAGWKQFDADLAVYVPPQAAAIVVARPVTALPAVSVQVEGQIVVHENFEKFGLALQDFIDNRLIRQPETDQDFADLDLQIKALKGAEAALDAAEAQMLAQVSTIDAANRTKNMLLKLARDNRLMAEKLLASRKEQIKADVMAGGVKAFNDHIAALNARLGQQLMPVVPTDFGNAVKNKRTVTSLRDSVDAELTRAKLAASAIADRMQINLRHLAEKAGDFGFLFSDLRQIVGKDTDDFEALVQFRVNDHQAKERKRAEELAEKERARIRAEEEERARAIAAREAQERADEEKRQRDAAAPAPSAPPAVPAPQAQPSTPSPAVAAPAPAAVPIRAGRAPLAATRPTDDAIIGALSLHYRVHESKVIEWLLSMDLKAASDRMAREFA